MTKNLNMKVVAEGVETVEQVVWLKDIGCDYAQGYYFDKPVNAEEFANIIADQDRYIMAV